MISDEQLMQEAKSTRPDNISILFGRYNTQLYTFFYHQNRSDALSKDLVQSVFEKIIKHKSSYKPTTPFKSWMYKIAWNVHNDYFRQRRTYYPGDDQIHHLLPDSEESEMDQHDERLRLHRALDLLSVEQKQLIHLVKFEGLKYSEVASILDLSESNIKVKVHRTIKKLKDIYFNLDHE